MQTHGDADADPSRGRPPPWAAPTLPGGLQPGSLQQQRYVCPAWEIPTGSQGHIEGPAGNSPANQLPCSQLTSQLTALYWQLTSQLAALLAAYQPISRDSLTAPPPLHACSAGAGVSVVFVGPMVGRVGHSTHTHQVHAQCLLQPEQAESSGGTSRK